MDSFHLATDQLEYFQQMRRLTVGHDQFELLEEPPNLPETKFEHRFREQGDPIYRLVLRKISPVI